MGDKPYDEAELLRIIGKVRVSGEGLTNEEALLLIEYTAFRELQAYFYASGLLRPQGYLGFADGPQAPDNSDDGISFID